MSVQGIWRAGNERDRKVYDAEGWLEHKATRGFIQHAVSSEFIEDGGVPFEDGEKVEILVRRPRT